MISLKSYFLRFREFMWNYPEIIKEKSPLSYIVISVILFLILVFLFFRFNIYTLSLFKSNTYTEGVVSNSTYYNPYSFYQNKSFVEDVNNLIFSNLIEVNNQGKIVGIVAKSWKEENRGTEYIFYLHKNFHFQNGESITSKDVIYSFDYYKKHFPSQTLSNITALSLGKYKVEFLLKRLDVTFFEDINFYIVPLNSHYYSKPSNITGSGEYKIDYLTKNKIVLSRFDDYFYGKPYFKYFVIKIFKNYSNILTSLKNDNIDGAYFPKLVTNLSSYPNLKIYTEPLVTNYTALFFNVSKITDFNLREAMAYSVSRKYIAQNLFLNHVTYMNTPIPLYSWAYSSSKKIPRYHYNLKMAADLISGNEYNLSVYYLNSLPSSLINYLHTQWKDIGVSVNFIPKSQSQINSLISVGSYSAILTNVSTSIDPNNLSLWYSKSTTNISKFNNSQVDQLLLVGISTTNISSRKETYAIFQKDIQDQSPAIFLYNSDFIYVANKIIKGINFSNLSYPYERFEYSYKWRY